MSRVFSLILLFSSGVLGQQVSVTVLPNGLKLLPNNIHNCRVSDGNSAYFIDFVDGQTVLRPITAEGNRNVWNGGLAGVPIDPAFVKAQKISSLIDKDVYVAQSENDKTTYLVDHGHKRGIRGETWETCQIKNSVPVGLEDSELAAIPSGPNLDIVVANGCGSACGSAGGGSGGGGGGNSGSSRPELEIIVPNGPFCNQTGRTMAIHNNTGRTITAIVHQDFGPSDRRTGDITKTVGPGETQVLGCTRYWDPPVSVGWSIKSHN